MGWVRYWWYGNCRHRSYSKFNLNMTDITMCKDWDCPNQDNCWRLNAPPNLHKQAYQDFKFDYDAYKTSDNENNGCDFYIAMDELKFNVK